jgi:hypothetical protein
MLPVEIQLKGYPNLAPIQSFNKDFITSSKGSYTHVIFKLKFPVLLIRALSKPMELAWPCMGVQASWAVHGLVIYNIDYVNVPLRPVYTQASKSLLFVTIFNYTIACENATL